jgi:hypothetical protein
VSLAALIFVAFAAPVMPAAPATVGRTGAAYDAEAHLLTAAGAAAGDLRAPTAAIARVKAERQARAQAEKKIVAALVELGDTRDLDALNKEVAQAKVGDERYGSDGSVQLTLTLATDELPLKHGAKKHKAHAD